MGYVQTETKRGWDLGGSPKGDRRGLSLANARRDRSVPEDTRRLKGVVADLATDKALLLEKIRHLEASRPLGWWRSKR
jgi:hypothetical protein